MATVEDYIAKRANESYSTLVQVVGGIVPLDFAGIGTANTIATATGSFLDEAGQAAAYAPAVKIGLANNAIISGVLNLAQDPDGGWFAFVSGAGAGVIGTQLAKKVFGATAAKAAAAFFAEATVITGVAITGIALVEGAVAVVIAETLTNIAKQGWSTFVTKEFDAHHDVDKDIYRIETNWSLQDNLYGTCWERVEYMLDFFSNDKDNLKWILEHSNGFDLIGINSGERAYLTYRKDTNTFAYGGMLESAKKEVSFQGTGIEGSSDIDAMIHLLEASSFTLVTADEVEHEVTAFKYIDSPSTLLDKCNTDDAIFAGVVYMQKYALSNDDTIVVESAKEIVESFSEQAFEHRCEMALAYAGGISVNLSSSKKYADLSKGIKQLGQNPVSGWIGFGGGGNQSLNGGDFTDYLYGAALPGLSNYDDTIYGRGGDDYIEGGRGKDTLYGGSGIKQQLFCKFMISFRLISKDDASCVSSPVL